MALLLCSSIPFDTEFEFFKGPHLTAIKAAGLMPWGLGLDIEGSLPSVESLLLFSKAKILVVLGLTVYCSLAARRPRGWFAGAVNVGAGYRVAQGFESSSDAEGDKRCKDCDIDVPV